MKRLRTLCLSLFVLHAQNLRDTQQLIVVTTENWSTSEGMLQRYEQQNESWVKTEKVLLSTEQNTWKKLRKCCYLSISIQKLGRNN